MVTALRELASKSWLNNGQCKRLHL
jgi:hypothetical protein